MQVDIPLALPPGPPSASTNSSAEPDFSSVTDSDATVLAKPPLQYLSLTRALLDAVRPSSPAPSPRLLPLQEMGATFPSPLPFPLRLPTTRTATHAHTFAKDKAAVERDCPSRHLLNHLRLGFAEVAFPAKS